MASHTKKLPVTLEPLGLPPKEGFAFIGVGNTKGYELLAAKEIEFYKVGKATRITTASLKAYVARRVAAQARKAA